MARFVAVYRSRTFKYISDSSRFKDAQLEQYFQLVLLIFDSRFDRFRFGNEFRVETNDDWNVEYENSIRRILDGEEK